MKIYLKCILLFLTLTFLLIVSCSEEAPVNLTSTPIAHAGTDQLVEFLDIVNLDGSLSTNTEKVEYIWSFNYKPPGSLSVLSDSSASNPTFIPDITGFYNVQLIIKDKEMYSEPDFITIQTIFKEPSEDYFPQKVGNKWKYKITDSTGTVTDTLIIEIVGTTTLQNGEAATIWYYNNRSLYHFDSYIDTLYLVTRVDTLVYYHIYRNNQRPFLGYIVPFQIGDSWGVDIPPIVTVLENNSISIDIGTFHGAYQMGHRIFYFTETYNWIVPGVGLVKMDLYSCFPGPLGGGICSEEHWELIWYNLVE